MTIIQKITKFIFTLAIISLFFTSCSNLQDEIVVKEVKSIPKKTKTIEKENDQNSSVMVTLTPLQRCKSKTGMFNLIVNAPVGSMVRILNIKPKYEDCIALKKGKYHIEVYQYDFIKYDRWISLNKSENIHVVLKKESIEKKRLEAEKRTQIIALEEAGYDAAKLQEFMNKYPNSLMVHAAKKRINRIKKFFRSYSPKGIIKSNDCIGFYPKSLVEKMLNIETSTLYWKSISWSGSCKNELMFGRGILYFDSDEGVHVRLKGKMKNGFFQGKVYNSSTAKNKTLLIKGNANAYFTVKLKNRFDFKQYQD